MAGRSGTEDCHGEKKALNGELNTTDHMFAPFSPLCDGAVSSETDRKKFSFVSLLLKGDGELETAQTLSFDLPQCQNTSLEQLMGSNFGPIVAVQSEALDVNPIVSGQFSDLYAQPFTSDPPQHQETTLGQHFGLNFPPMVVGQSRALHFHQQPPGQFGGVNAALIAAGNLEAIQHQRQNTNLNQHHQAAVVAEKSLFQACTSGQNYGWSETSSTNFIPQLYPHNTYGSSTSTFLLQNGENVHQQNDIQHPRHLAVHGSHVTDHSYGLGTDGMQVDQIPWQHHGLLEQQPNISTQILPAIRHAKQDKGKATVVQNSGFQGITDTKLPKDRGPFVTLQELSARTTTKATCALVEEPKQSPSNKKYCAMYSSEQLCRDSQFSCQPASFQLKMSENYQRKCKNVISKINSRIKEDGHIIVPLIADIWNRDDKSAYKMNFTCIRTVDFRNISQCLHENGFETLYDFIDEVQSMLKGVVDDFWFSCEVVNEVNIIHNLFFGYLERAFDDIDFSKQKEELEFSSTKEVKLLSNKLRRNLRE